MTKANEVLEIYRIYVTTIIAQEQHRYQIIAVYSTLMAGAWAILVTTDETLQTLIIMAIYVISIIWFLTVCAFIRLSKAKFAVISRLEVEFSVQPFGWEWEYIKNQKAPNARLSLLDVCVPLLVAIFAFIYQVPDCIWLWQLGRYELGS